MPLPHWLNSFCRQSRFRWSRTCTKSRRRHQCGRIVAAQIESCEPRIVLDAAAGAVARDALAADSDDGLFASFVAELSEVGQAINDVAVDALLSADEALNGALFAADSSLNTVIDLVEPVSDSIYGSLDSFVDTVVPLVDAGIDVLQALADSTLLEDFVDDAATAALGYVETAIAESPITVWLYTGDFDATPEMIAAAYDAAGMFYIGNAGLAHEALGGVDGELADSVATVLVWIEGEELHSMDLENTPDLPSGVVYLPGGPDDLPAEYLAGPNVPPVQVIPANQAVLVAIRDYWRTIAAGAQLVETLEPIENDEPGQLLTGDQPSEEEAIENGLSIRDPRYPWHNLHETEEHHPLMQGLTYREYWLDRGFTNDEIDSFTVPLDKDIHQAITNSGWWDNNLFQEIEEQEENLDRPLNRDEVMSIVDKLLDALAGFTP